MLQVLLGLQVLAQPSGDITEYITCSNITLFDEANAIAPPDPPSPIIIEILGTSSFIHCSIDLALLRPDPSLRRLR